MRRKGADSVIQLLRRGFTAQSFNFSGEKRIFQPIDFSTVRQVNDAILLFHKMKAMSPQPSIRVYNKLLSVLARMEEYTVALSVFDELRQSRVPLHEYTMNIIINCCCNLNRVDLGFAVLGSFLKQDYKPDVTTFSTLLRGLMLVGKVEKAKSLFSKVLIFKLCEPNGVTILCMINGLCKLGQTLAALDLLRALEKASYKPDVKSYGAVIDGLCRDGMVDEALHLLMEMPVKHIQPNAVIYNTIIHGLCRFSRWNDLKYILLIEMVDHKVPLDVFAFTGLIDVHSKEGNMRDAESLLQLMVEMNVLPNILTYNIMIEAYCKAGMVDKALHLLTEMSNRGIHPDVVTYSSIMHGLSRFSRWNEMKYILLVKMVEHEVPLDVFIFNILMDVHCKEGKMTDAESILRLMFKTNVCPDIFTYNSMIEGYCKGGNVDKAWHLFEAIPRVGLKHSIVNYNTMIDGFFLEGRVCDGWKLFEDMEARGIHADLWTYNIVISALCKVGKLDEARDLFNRIPSKGLQPNIYIYCTIVDSLLKQGLDEEAKCLLNEMEKNGVAPDSVMYRIIVGSLLKRNKGLEETPFLVEMYNKGFIAHLANVSMPQERAVKGVDVKLVEEIKKVEPQKLSELF